MSKIVIREELRFPSLSVSLNRRYATEGICFIARDGAGGKDTDCAHQPYDSDRNTATIAVCPILAGPNRNTSASNDCTVYEFMNICLADLSVTYETSWLRP